MAVPEPSGDDLITRPIRIPRQILVVDDREENLVAAEAALAPLGHALITVRSGTEALACLLEQDVSLVLLDVQMPDMDGYETASLIRSRERTAHLPIIFLTAHDCQREAVLRAYRLGAVDFLFKPVEPEILRAKAEVLMTLQDRTVEVAELNMQRAFEAQRQRYEVRQLARMNDQLAEHDRRKNEFLAMLAHELRNPLAPLRTCIDLVKETRERALSDRMLDVFDRQLGLLTRLVDDLLDISRITANKIELRPERIELAEVLETAITTSKPRMAARHHQLTVLREAPAIPVVADAVRLVQVLSNLLNNAARYTEVGGRIEVACGVRGERAYVRVTDTGIGIPPELLPSIFDMFVQERVRSDGSGGLGLGLALARRLVEMHHGTIRATSAGRGQGSTFEVELPLAGTPHALTAKKRSSEMEPLPRPAPPPMTATPRRLRALIVDDNEDARELLAHLLGRHGHDVLTAGDGPSAIAMIREHRPDVAILDIGLPGMSGLEVARALREQLPELATRLVALTGYSNPDDQQRTRDAGFHDHLVKPATSEALLRCLQR